MVQKSCKRPWRKLVKKLQRKRKRQKFAQQRDKELENAELEKLKDPLYKSCLEEQEIVGQQQQQAEETVRQEQEELWLRREIIAQNYYKAKELKRQAEEAVLEAERLKQYEILNLLEEKRQKKREEIKLQAQKATNDFNNIMSTMQEYLEDCTMKTPTRLDCFVESRPGEKSCDFFGKTNCCRYDPTCSFNHKRPMLGKILLIKHFFQHPLLEQQEHNEYSRSDSALELSERDLRDAYDEFCEDVWPVLEQFGSIVNFRTVRNVEAHLRGHVFVEYTDKRSALKCFTNLHNRYYASKRLNVEFSNIRQWRTGVCGLSLGRKCPKGVYCNFLHLMKNINNKYNKPIHNLERSSRSQSASSITQKESPLISWNSEDTLNKNEMASHSRYWRWSESPDIELNSKNKKENPEVQSSLDSKGLSSSSSHKRSGSRSRSTKSLKRPVRSRSSHYKITKSHAAEKQNAKLVSKSERKHKERSESETRKRPHERTNLHYHKDSKKEELKSRLSEGKKKSKKAYNESHHRLRSCRNPAKKK